MTREIAAPLARPVYFGDDQVRATLDGRKMVFRRPLLPQPPEWVTSFGYKCFTPPGQVSGRGYWKGVPGEEGPGEKFFPCPYGRRGDELYVREAWRPWSWHEGEPVTLEFRAGGPRAEVVGRTVELQLEVEKWEEDLVVELADELEAKGVGTDEDGTFQWQGESPVGWRSPLHLPYWASRIRLEVLRVSVERVRDVTEEDARSEGVRAPGERAPWTSARALFRERWNDRYATPTPVISEGVVMAYEAFPFDASHEVCSLTEWEGLPLQVTPNPWVFRVAFRRTNP